MKIKALQRKLLGLDAFQARFRVDVSDSSVPSRQPASRDVARQPQLRGRS